MKLLKDELGIEIVEYEVWWKTLSHRWRENTRKSSWAHVVEIFESPESYNEETGKRSMKKQREKSW